MAGIFVASSPRRKWKAIPLLFLPPPVSAGPRALKKGRSAPPWPLIHFGRSATLGGMMDKNSFVFGALALVLAFGAGCSANNATNTDGSNSGAGGQGASGSGGSGVVDAGPIERPPADHTPSEIVCPTSAPFDDSDPAVVAACTQPVLVAVGQGQRRAISFDGVTWPRDEWFPTTAFTDQNENSNTDAAIGKGVIVVVGDGGIQTSTNGGDSFTTTKTDRQHGACVAYYNGQFVVVSGGATNVSSDGTNWTSWGYNDKVPGNLSGNFLGSSCTIGPSGGQNVLVVLNGTTGTYRIYDGTTWVERPLPTNYSYYSRLIWGGDRYVVTGSFCCDEKPNAGLRGYSTDLVNWTIIDNSATGAANDVLGGELGWDSTQFFITGGVWDTDAYTSTDGLVWNQMTLRDVTAKSTAAIGPWAVFNGLYVGAHLSVLYTSPDRQNWTQTYTAVGDKMWGFAKIRVGNVLSR
jgi:hypothetical protein